MPCGFYFHPRETGTLSAIPNCTKVKCIVPSCDISDQRGEWACNEAIFRQPFIVVTDLPSDPFKLSRFVIAQENSWPTALDELREGKKRSHWMWYVFPQVAGLGSSAMAKQYAIQSRAEAEAFLAHPLLGSRLEACATALVSVEGRSAEQIMGSPDCLKLRSSMTLFAAVTPPGSVFERVLGKYYAGVKDEKTIEFLRQK